ncbi:MAG: polyprenol monophosphomannose synthase [Candidatus Liptonbacteria bacterium]|nr:polyprenol monophosphomannose synthase [Candidatus Liptonbacteria bacterium]
MPKGGKSVLAIPTYNERESVGILLPLIKKLYPSLTILIVDDNSPDGTGEEIKNLQAQYQGIILLSRPSKIGLASAYLAAFQTLLQDPTVQCVITMDADFSHDPEAITSFLEEINRGNDVVIGSRYAAHGRTENWNWKRRMLSKYANIYARTITGLPIHDLTTGFVAYRRNILEQIVTNGFSHEGYAFQIEAKWLAHARGARIVEIPIIFRERQNGVSKMSGEIMMEGIVAPWRLRFRKKLESKLQLNA